MSDPSTTPDPSASEWPDPSASDQHLIDCIGDGFLSLNAEGAVIYANASASRILGISRERLRHRSLLDLFPQLNPNDLHVESQTANTSVPIPPLRIPVFLGCELHQFEFDIHPYQDGIGVLFRDVSERVKQEMEIAKLNATMAISQQLLRSKNEELGDSLEKLARLNEELANADQLKSEFLANTSHELRTPLNSIIGFLQLVNEGLCESREEEMEYVRNALASAQHLLCLINDVLDVAKIEAGKMTLLIDDIDLDTLFHDVLSLMHIQAQRKRLELTFEIKDETRRVVRADFQKVKQVLINLVGNAVKFTNRGSIAVWAESDPDRSDMVRISVADTGIGVAPHLQQAIFEKFIQVDGTSTRKYQGTGLGLAISKNLVELMGGTIGIHSEGDHQGTTMRFTLPLGNACRGGGGLVDDYGSTDGLPTTF